MTFDTPVVGTAMTVTGTAQALANYADASLTHVVLTPTDGTVYIGGSTVTTSNGTPIVAGQSVPINTRYPANFWLVSGGSVNVRVLYGLGTV